VQSISGAERAALCDLFDELGPDAPTLCEGWTTSDLAAHLYVRERRPDAAPGVLFRPLAGYNAKTMGAVLKHLGYAGVVQKVRGGPPLPLRLFDSQMNTLEYFVHHEDVRRAAEDWEPREDRELDAALWKVLRRAAWMLSRQLKGARLDLVRPDGETIKGRAGESRVAIKGGPQELTLYLFGRTKVARVTIEGDEPGRAALERATFGV
jgi:uncharacterized protein (TIGR03085 family)